MSNQAIHIPSLALKTVCEFLAPYTSITPQQFKTMLNERKSESQSDRLLKLKEVQKILGVSHRHLYNLEERGELTFVRIGGAVRVKESDVNALLNGGV